MTEGELRRIATSVGARRGWDFSRMRETQEPAPWDYADIARAYLAPDSHVLDIGTGGGERFLALGVAGLQKDAPRPGRTPTISAWLTQRVVTMTTRQQPRNATHWSTRTMAAAVGISPASVADDLYLACHEGVLLPAADVRDVFLGEKQFLNAVRLVPVDNVAALIEFSKVTLTRLK
jgi:hypothetical protein